MASIFRDQMNIKQESSHTYTATADEDWALGPVLIGSSVAAVLHAAASLHLRTTLEKFKQPDIHTLHVEFFRPCVVDDIAIKITDLKVGKGTCFLQLNLSQDDEEKTIALVTSTNFDVEFGPTAKTDWALHPAPAPIPDFKKIEAQQPEDNWLPIRIVPVMNPTVGRLLWLHPRIGYPVDGSSDIWYSFASPERITADYLPYLMEIMPSPTDTLLHRGGRFDAREDYAASVEWAAKNPGVPVVFKHSLEEIMQKSSIETTTTMDIEFKGRLPKEGLRWVFSRTAIKMMKGGRLDLNVTLCDEGMQPLCFGRLTMLSHDVARRFRTAKATKL